MALEDLTGKNIQDTYKRLVQTEGNTFADGSGSAIEIFNVTSSHAVSASYALSASHEITYELSSSHAETADALTPGIDIDVRHVTASGNISASGTITADQYRIDSNSLAFKINPTEVGLIYEDNTSIRIGRTGNPTKIVGALTASGNISASGVGTFLHTRIDNTYDFIEDGGNIEGWGYSSGKIRSAQPIHVAGNIENEGSIYTTGNITASNNISASGVIISEKYEFGHGGGAAYLQATTNDALLAKFGNSKFEGHITASGNISASGRIFTEHLYSSDDAEIVDSLTIGGTISNVSTTHITASGNISASGIITAEGLVISDDASINDGLEVGNNILLRNTKKININNTGGVAKGIITLDASNQAIFGATDLNTIVQGNTFVKLDAAESVYIDADNGNIQFQDNSNTKITFNTTIGHITASGQISASGTVYGLQYYIQNQALATRHPVGGIAIGNDSDKIEIDGANIILDASVTASIISASSKIMADNLTAATAVTADRFVSTGLTQFGSDIVDMHTFTGHVTASGNISASGNIIGAKLIVGDPGGPTLDVADWNNVSLLLGDFGNSVTIRGTETIFNNGGLDVQSGHITASGDISASGNIIAPKHINQVIPIVQNSAYFNNVEGQYALYVGNGTYGWNDRVWNKSYPLSGSDTMTNDFNSNGNANCGVFVTHKLKNLRLIGSIKPSSNTPNPNTLAFYLYKLPSYSTTAGAGSAPQPVFIASASSADTAGTSFRTVFITGSVVNSSVGLDPGDSLIVGVNSSTTSGNIKFTYSVTGELDE